ncbi:MAG: tripartite tricarboxylate transporter TctB family protein [Rhodocyclaceae bacterium]|nr:tripartite tricarboxylate transporter TctB family protein [Rhodocyclaceae bacterium]MCB1892076.1 tripartite tricarboxylate transporter TctB family protein [Rhodocyclaceae bacterium]MCW5596898.1 tripartite tricarboxylate transporter TctB family protein [Rhodocyclaceae bacterium]
MNSIVKGPKDFLAGVLYFGIGATALFAAREYEMGSAARMGPGYFPTILSGLLMLFGIISILRSIVVSSREAVGKIAWKPILSVTGGIVCFAFLLRPAGMLIALIALILISASASAKFRFDWRATIAMLCLVALSGLVFVKGLGVPMPLLGNWFDALR